MLQGAGASATATAATTSTKRVQWKEALRDPIINLAMLPLKVDCNDGVSVVIRRSNGRLDSGWSVPRDTADSECFLCGPRGWSLPMFSVEPDRRLRKDVLLTDLVHDDVLTANLGLFPPDFASIIAAAILQLEKLTPTATRPTMPTATTTAAP